MHPPRIWQLICGFSGFIGVAAGAVGAHVIADATAAIMVEKAAFYQLIHTVALLFLSAHKGRAVFIARLCWLGGIVLFCGSLYAKGIGIVASAPAAPMGGTLLMIGWLALACNALPKTSKKEGAEL